jgi:hypothetical protein
MMSVPTLSVRVGQPAKEIGDLFILPLPRPNHKVPVVRHHRIAEDPQRHPLERFQEDLFEGREIAILLKQPQPAIRPIEHMVRVTTNDRPSTPRHAAERIAPTPTRQELIPVPFNSSWAPSRTRLNVSGVVLDASTNRPVAEARVVVVVVEEVPFSEWHLGYGIVTDENGRFAVNVRTPIRFHRIYIAASTPDDMFASESNVTSSVVLRAAPLPAKYQGDPWMHYDGFRGSIALIGSDAPGIPPKLSFVGESW